MKGLFTFISFCNISFTIAHLNITKNGGLDEVALGSHSLTACDKLCTVVLSSLNVAHHFVEMGTIHLHIYLVIEYETLKCILTIILPQLLLS